MSGLEEIWDAEEGDHLNYRVNIVLRCLHVRGRATTADPIMKFLCELGDNGVVWNVLSYWSARLY